MKVGDLVTYSGSELTGIVLSVHRVNDKPAGCKVQWSNGQTCSHSASWLIKVKTSEDR